MRTPTSVALVLSLALASLGLVHCSGPSVEPAVPGPTPPPAETAAPVVAPTASATEAPTAAPTGTAGADAHAAAPPHWTYSGEEGPEKWGDLSPEYAACKVGTSQSPVDILTKKVEPDKTLGALGFDYAAKTPLQIFNNGHTVQVQNGGAAALRAGGADWKLVQLHFHSPSEHAIDGKLADLEGHFVHKNDKGELSVVGLLFRKGKENKALSVIFDHVPVSVTKDPIEVPGTMIDFAPIVPAKSSYFAYPGSLTTPKCTEGVHWYVLKTVSEVSEAQLERFQHALHGANNRPLQPLGARKITRPN